VRVVVQHRICYRNPRPALLGPQLIRLRPADHVRARVERYQLQIAPEHRLYRLRDPHGNRVARVTLGPSGRRCSTCVCGIDISNSSRAKLNAVARRLNQTLGFQTPAEMFRPNPISSHFGSSNGGEVF